MNYEEAYKILFGAITDTIDLLVDNTIKNSNSAEIIMPKLMHEAINILRVASLKTEQMYIDDCNS